MNLTNPVFNLDPNSLKSDIDFIKKSPFGMAFIRRRNVFFQDAYRYSHDVAQERWGIKFAFYESGKSTVKRVLQSENANKEAAELWLKKIEEDVSFADSLVKELQNVIEMQKKIAADIPLVSLTNESVAESVDTFVDYWVKFFSLAFLWFAVDPMKDEIDRQIKASWTASESELTNFLDSVYRPMQLPLSSKEQRDILKLVNLQGEEFNTALHAHVKAYRHLSVHDIDDQFFDEEYYRGRIKPLNDPSEFKKQKDLLEQADKEITDAHSLLESAKLSDSLKNKINFVRWFMYLRTESIDHFMLVNSVYKPIFEFIGNNFGLTVVEVLNMTYKEIVDSLTAGKLALEQSVIKNRTEKGYGYFIGPFTSVLVTGDDIDALEKLVLPQNNNKEIRELKGQIAYPGKVTAKARVILDRKHAVELQEGEILVTTMTAPDFVPAMKISAAIVTNEGGVLCHAAIMSRELRRPCVIGTKIATDVIKTGDLVEVDAEKGIVRLIK